MIYRFDEKICLNGWWDILPVYDDSPCEKIPAKGWLEKKYLVPSFYNKPYDAVRKPGEKYYCENPNIVSDPDTENLFDAFGYPAEWTKAKRIWVRRTFELRPQTGRRYFFIAEAIGPTATIFINGKEAACSHEYTLPTEVDITSYVVDGKNELVLFLDDYERDENGDSLHGTGNWLTNQMRGIQRDVWLIEKGDVYIDDLTIVTSVREKTLKLKYVIKNTTDSAMNLIIKPTIKGNPVEIPEITGKISAQSEATTEISIAWENPKLWDTFTPNLYYIRTAVLSDGTEIDHMTERFGFRELWAEGDKLLLNGHPLHLFSDFGHKATPYSYTRGWIEKWFSMLRDYHMNHSRLHTHPHPELILDMADEAGIYITSETNMHGSGSGQAAADIRYWQNGQQHVRDLVKREKNHPCVILYSCGNELRWTGRQTEMMKTEAPKIRALFNELDPTRIAYHEGDSSLWDETTQEMLSRHYGKDVSGIGWWDKTHPLNSGEMCLYHYLGHNNMLQFIGDDAWREYDRLTAAATKDLVYVVEDARSNGVCCLGPWNMSCHMNLRPHGEKTFTYKDYTAPGMKPLFVKEGVSEFDYWSKNAGKGYITQPGTEDAALAFRPLAVIDRSRRTGFYPDVPIEREVYIVNDTKRAIIGVFTCAIKRGASILRRYSCKINMERGETKKLNFTLKPVGKCGNFTEVLTIKSGLRELEHREKPIRISAPKKFTLKNKIAVIGSGYFKELLSELGAAFEYHPQTFDGFGTLIIEKDAVEAGSGLNKAIKTFAENGGNVLIFEQRISPLPGVKLVQKPVQSAFIRSFDTVLTEEIENDDLAMWSEDPYTLISGDAFVARKMYQKDDGTYIKPIIDSGEGDFGDGDLSLTPLFEIAVGKGKVIACQLRVTEKFTEIPAARQLIFNMLRRAEQTDAKKKAPKVLGTFAEAAAALSTARKGDEFIIFRVGLKMAEIITEKTGIPIKLTEDPEGIYGGVRSGDISELSGVSNEDLSGMERVSYCSPESENIPVAKYLIQPAKGIEALVETCPQNCMVPLYEHKNRSEMLRSYCAMNYCYQNNEQPKILAAKFKFNGATVWISCFDFELNKRGRFGRFENQLKRNLGIRTDAGALLDGGIEPTNGSKGCPERIYTISADQFPPEVALHFTKYLTERMNASPILAAANFEEKHSSEGDFIVTGDTLIYFTLFSPTARKNLGSNIGVPDPGAQTFADIEANGEISLWINSQEKGTANVSGSAVFADLELESGLNHILIRYQPKNGAGPFKINWRNILRHPESDFNFSTKGNGA
ncbi:MAG TPA: glycoside hydrolase family 2 TIM barrel-domain containing protein [Oscillospiraceae bacterium]|nr:glycoside hydrolase family 2 TIM barrel-domain containing protein [Oscillospiraceae bacterium]HPS35362.1 glycoside hydrolase family 2 TIM barrel-domain containing protein [Oscillospiraceae bacterium]